MLNSRAKLTPVPSPEEATDHAKLATSYPSQLEECILIALVGQERYGLEIIEILDQNSKGRLVPSIGTLYPTLQRLEQKNCLTSRMEATAGKGRARRKYFRITQIGQHRLAELERLRSDIYACQA
jgi:DNA-binding PadR family transcriptional regulator